MVNYYKDIKSQFTDLYKTRIVDNEKLMPVTFHSLIGVVNPVNYIFSGNYYSTRINPFMIQSPGTGKGAIMNFTKDIVTGMHCIEHDIQSQTMKVVRINPETVQKATDAGLYCQERINPNGSRTLIPGILSTSRLIMYDEAIELMNKNNYYDSVRTLWCMALNEDLQGGGFVNRILKSGNLPGYSSRATLMAGSVFNPEFLNSILGEGLFQRVYLSFQNFTDEQRIKMIRQQIKLTSIDRAITKPMRDALVDTLRKWQSEAYNKYVKANCSRPYIKFKPDSQDKMGELLMDYYDKEIKDTFSGNKQGRLLDFLQRSVIEKSMKIAVQKAVLELRDEVTDDDYAYGIEMTKYNMESARDMLVMTGKSKTSTPTTELEKERLWAIIDNATNTSGGIERPKLLSILDGMKKSKEWMFGENRTIKMIESLEKESRIEGLNIGLDGGGHVKKYKAIKC